MEYISFYSCLFMASNDKCNLFFMHHCTPVTSVGLLIIVFLYLSFIVRKLLLFYFFFFSNEFCSISQMVSLYIVAIITLEVEFKMKTGNLQKEYGSMIREL